MSKQISELKVMKSNAGYYLGHTLDGMPFDRMSSYCPKKEWAEKVLLAINSDKDVGVSDKTDRDIVNGFFEHICTQLYLAEKANK